MSTPDIDDNILNQLVSATYLRLGARELGIDKQNAPAFLKNTQLTYEQLHGLDEKISLRDLLTIIGNALTLCADPALGLVLGEKLRVTTHGSLGVVLMSSPDVRTMLKEFSLYAAVPVPFLKVTLNKNNHFYVLEIVDLPPSIPFHASISELVLTSVQSVIEDAIGKKITTGRFNFIHAKPEYATKYQEILHSPCQFSTKNYQYCIPIDIGNSPSIFSDEHLLKHAKNLCDKQLNEITKSSTLENEIKTLLYENIGHIWTIDDVAMAMNTSKRTVARKLKNEGCTYKSILDSVHKEVASNYLMRDNLSVDRIGFLIGYSDSSNFRRSFKRWFGMTPTQYIASLKQK